MAKLILNGTDGVKSHNSVLDTDIDMHPFRLERFK
jgi:hypothetical protein